MYIFREVLLIMVIFFSLTGLNSIEIIKNTGAGDFEVITQTLHRSEGYNQAQRHFSQAWRLKPKGKELIKLGYKAQNNPARGHLQTKLRKIWKETGYQCGGTLTTTYMSTNGLIHLQHIDVSFELLSFAFFLSLSLISPPHLFLTLNNKTHFLIPWMPSQERAYCVWDEFMAWEGSTYLWFVPFNLMLMSLGIYKCCCNFCIMIVWRTCFRDWKEVTADFWMKYSLRQFFFFQASFKLLEWQEMWSTNLIS